MVAPGGLRLKLSIQLKPEAQRDLAAAPEILAEELQAGLERSMLAVESEIKKQITTIHLIDTGLLRASIHGEKVQIDGPRFHGEVATGSNVVYARIHEFGGTIVPKNARVLAWVDKGIQRPERGDKATWNFLRTIGAAHFARSVTITAKHYMRDGLKNATGRVKWQIREAVKRAWARILYNQMQDGGGGGGPDAGE